MAKLSIEVFGLLNFFAVGLIDTVSTNLMIFRTCTVILGYNETECALLGKDNQSNATAALEQKVQPHANVISMVQTCMESLISPFVCFFIGALSDKNGRKPVLLAATLGFTLSTVIGLVVYLIRNASPWFFLLVSIPTVLTGGFSCLLTMLMCYISDVTSEENRGVRMGIFEGISMIGNLIGISSSSHIFKYGGYTLVYSISAVCGFLAFLYLLVFIPESVHLNDEIRIKNDGKPFDLQLLKDTIRTLVRRREGNGRALLLCFITVMAITFLTFSGSDSLVFLFVREAFHWSLRIYTYFSAYTTVIWAIGGFLGIYVMHKILRISEQYLILLGFLASAFAFTAEAVAWKGWMLFVTAAVKMFGAVISPLCRSLVSKTVEPAEIGKIFSFISALQSFTGLFATPLYTLIYNATVKTSAGFFNFVNAGFYGLGVLIMTISLCIRRKELTTYDVLDEDVVVTD